MKKHLLHPDTGLGIALVLFIFVIIGAGMVFSAPLFSQKVGQCPQEARTCPDGSKVVRSGPACTFTPCQRDALPAGPGLTEEPLITTPEKTPPKNEEPKSLPSEELKKEVLCTQDAKMCPDGSFVGRVAPKCAFAPCPTSTDTFSSGDVSL